MEADLSAEDAFMQRVSDAADVIEAVNGLAHFELEYKNDIVDRLKRAEAAVREFIEWRERGRAEGGPFQRATLEDVEHIRRITELIAQWRESKGFSPEILDHTSTVVAMMAPPSPVTSPDGFANLRPGWAK